MFTLMIVCTSYTRPMVPGPLHHKEPDGEQPSSKWWSTSLAHFKIRASKLMIPSQMFERKANSSHTPGNTKIMENKIAIKLFCSGTVFLAQVLSMGTFQPSSQDLRLLFRPRQRGEVLVSAFSAKGHKVYIFRKL